MKATILERRATLFVGAPIKVTSDNIPIFITTFSQMGLEELQLLKNIEEKK